MRTLEMLVLIMVVPVIIGLLLRRSIRPDWLRIFSWSALVLMLLHLWFEKYRWQMGPAYLLVAVVFLLVLRNAPVKGTKDSHWRTAGRVAVAVLGIFVCAAAAFLSVMIPVFHDPAPTGPFAVGSTSLHLIDSLRHDPFAPDPHGPRELLVVVWYPAEIPAGARAEDFLPELSTTGPVIANRLHLPSFVFAHLSLVKSHSYRDVPVARAQAKYPVLIFSHGFGGTPRQNTPQMEELASHGFIVFSIGHTYESAALAFPGGRIVPISRTRFEAVTRSAAWPENDGLKGLTAANSPTELRRILAK